MITIIPRLLGLGSLATGAGSLLQINSRQWGIPCYADAPVERHIIRGYRWVPAVDFNRVHGIIGYHWGP